MINAIIQRLKYTSVWKVLHISVYFFCEVTNHFATVRKSWVVKGIVPVIEGLNIINLYAISDPVTGPEQRINVVLGIQCEKVE